MLSEELLSCLLALRIAAGKQRSAEIRDHTIAESENFQSDEFARLRFVNSPVRQFINTALRLSKKLTAP
jgi:hypothetical protein